MEVDTGAFVGLVSEQIWQRQLQQIPLQETNIRLRTYTGKSITVLGQILNMKSRWLSSITVYSWGWSLRRN